MSTELDLTESIASVLDDLLTITENKILAYRMLGASAKSYSLTKPVSFVDFIDTPGINAKAIGCYMIVHADGTCAYVGQGLILSRLKRHMYLHFPGKWAYDSTLNYDLPKKLLAHDADANNWFVQYIVLPEGPVTKEIARALESELQLIHDPLYSSFHMAGIS